MKYRLFLSLFALLLITYGYLTFNKKEEYLEHPIKYSLNMIASEKMRDLLINNFWSHDNSNMTFEERAKLYKIFFRENLYKGEKCDINAMVSMWNASPTHKENLTALYSEGVLLIASNSQNCYGVLITN